MNNYYLIGSVLVFALTAVGVFLSLKKLYGPCKEFYRKYCNNGTVFSLDTKFFGKKIGPKAFLTLAFLPITKILYPLSFFICSLFDKGELSAVDGRLFLFNCLAIGLLCMLIPCIQGGLIGDLLDKVSEYLNGKGASPETKSLGWPFVRDYFLPIAYGELAIIVLFVVSII